MVVEQRIGRVDRIGQTAERIVVANLFIENSIEERIVMRLLERIGVFEQSIGELDAIVGESIEEITRQVVSGRLSPEEAERKAQESGDALQRNVQEARHVLTRVDGLLAADQALVDEINAVTGERQIPAASEMLVFLNDWLEASFPGHQLAVEATERVVQVDLRGSLAQAVEERLRDPDAFRFGRRAMAGLVPLTLSRDAAYRHPGAELLHLKHPLVRLAIDSASDVRESYKEAFYLKLPRSERLPPGTHLFATELVESHGQRPWIRICASFAALGGSSDIDDPDQAVGALLELADHGEDCESLPVSPKELQAAKVRVLSSIDRTVNEWSQREAKIEGSRREQQHAIQLAIEELKLSRARARLATVEAHQANNRVLLMARGMVAAAEKRLQTFLVPRPVGRYEPPDRQSIAVGVVEVVRGTA